MPVYIVFAQFRSAPRTRAQIFFMQRMRSMVLRNLSHTFVADRCCIIDESPMPTFVSQAFANGEIKTIEVDSCLTNYNSEGCWRLFAEVPTSFLWSSTRLGVTKPAFRKLSSTAMKRVAKGLHRQQDSHCERYQQELNETSPWQPFGCLGAVLPFMAVQDYARVASSRRHEQVTCCGRRAESMAVPPDPVATGALLVACRGWRLSRSCCGEYRQTPRRGWA